MHLITEIKRFFENQLKILEIDSYEAKLIQKNIIFFFKKLYKNKDYYDIILASSYLVSLNPDIVKKFLKQLNIDPIILSLIEDATFSFNSPKTFAGKIFKQCYYFAMIRPFYLNYLFYKSEEDYELARFNIINHFKNYSDKLKPCCNKAEELKQFYLKILNEFFIDYVI